MRRMLVLSLSLLAVWLLPGAAGAGDDGVYAPPKGSPLRAHLLDTARPAFERDVGAPVEFVVRTLNVWGGWAFGNVKLQRPGGVPINWRRTKFAADLAQGMLETESHFFLLRETEAGWQLVEHVIGPTDVAWDWWREQHNLPYALFGVSAEELGAPAPRTRPRPGG